MSGFLVTAIGAGMVLYFKPGLKFSDLHSKPPNWQPMPC